MKEISTLIWSEWRRQRKTFFFLLFISLFFYSLITIFLQTKLFLSGIKVVAGALSVGLPLLYAIALGDSFASEFMNKSSSFLLGLPISKTKIYFIKYVSSLILFLPISVAGCLLMYTCSSGSFSEIMSRGVVLISTFLLSIWILVHAAVFLCNLINRNSNNGVIMLLIIPVLLIILAPGVFVINMFLYTSDAYWLISSIFSTIIALYLILLILGWHLWNDKISLNLKVLRPILLTLGVMLYFSLALYFCADIYTEFKYKSQRKKLLNIYNRYYRAFKAPVIFIDTRIAMENIRRFQKYRKNHASSNMHVYSHFAKRTHLDIWGGLESQQKTERNNILNETAVQKMYDILENSNKLQTKAITRFTNTPYNTKIAIIFLVDLAYAQSRAGKYKAFFKSLNIATAYCAFLSRMLYPYQKKSNARLLLRLVYLTMIKHGPEGPEYEKNYQTAFKFIQKDKIYCLPYTFADGYYYAEGLANPKSSTNLLNKIYYRLRARQGLISWNKYKIKRYKLCLEAEKMSNLKEIMVKNKKLIKESQKIPGYCGILASKQKGLDKYFFERYKFTGDKICLALKIFRCRYRKYPDKLQELSPNILKEIPLVPIAQKAYEYKKYKDGFILNAQTIKRKQWIWKYKMEYQPWERSKK